jgi:N-acetylglucosaminyldiphosphoundecaprenol N-acetyl-beta-D-mannosaminyltransferase
VTGESDQQIKSDIEQVSTANRQPPIACCTIAGIPVHNLSEDETTEKIFELVKQGGSHYMAVVNAAKIVNARSDDGLRRILLNADIVTADGMSVVWASRLLGQSLKERVTGIDLFERLVSLAAERNLSVYFFGARDEAVLKVIEIFKGRLPNLRVAGGRNGYFTASENPAIVEEIKQSQADLLFVAMGSPAQEKWIAANLQQTGVGFALGVGGSFDHVAGFVRRAPLWMQQAGLEWLHRFLLEPHRLWRRYLIGNTRFVWLVLKQLLRQSIGEGKRQK